MEYNYTRELKQPRKVYKIGSWTIPLIQNGLQLSHLVGGAVIFLVIVLFLILGVIMNVAFIRSLIVNGWLLLSLAIIISLWALFSIKWEKKGVLRFIFDKLRFKKTKTMKIEHSHIIPDTHENAVCYKSIKIKKRAC